MTAAIDYEEATRAELESWAGASATFKDRGKHRSVVLRFHGRSRFVIYPTSPSDRARGISNHIALVRRELKRLGAVRGVRV